MRESLPSSSGGLPSRTSAEHLHPSVFTYLCTSVDQASPSTAPSVFHMSFPRAGPDPIPVRPLPHLHMLRRRVPQRRGCRVHVIVARRPRQGRRGCYKRRGQAGSAGSSALPSSALIYGLLVCCYRLHTHTSTTQHTPWVFNRLLSTCTAISTSTIRSFKVRIRSGGGRHCGCIHDLLLLLLAGRLVGVYSPLEGRAQPATSSINSPPPPPRRRSPPELCFLRRWGFVRGRRDRHGDAGR